MDAGSEKERRPSDEDVAELLALIRKLEWCDDTSECHVCGHPWKLRGVEGDGKHFPDCRLGSLLDKLGRE